MGVKICEWNTFTHLEYNNLSQGKSMLLAWMEATEIAEWMWLGEEIKAGFSLEKC